MLTLNKTLSFSFRKFVISLVNLTAIPLAAIFLSYGKILIDWPKPITNSYEAREKLIEMVSSKLFFIHLEFGC